MTKSEAFALIEKKANELVAKSAGAFTRHEAVVKVCEQHPDLYRQYRDAADSPAPAQAETATVLHVARQTVKREIEHVMKARGKDRGDAAMIVATENPDLITLSRDPASAHRLVDAEQIQKSADWLQRHISLSPGQALIRALEYDALPPQVSTVPVAATPPVQKDTTDEKIEKASKICKDLIDYLEKECGVPPRPPVVRKFNRAMTFNEIRALDRTAAA